MECENCGKTKKDVRFEGSEEKNLCDKCLFDIKHGVVKPMKITKEMIKDIHLECFCDRCNKMIPRQFRFTDWENDKADVFGDLDCCLSWFKKAIIEEPKGRFSIYAVTICEKCDSLLEDDGVLFNTKCDEYGGF